MMRSNNVPQGLLTKPIAHRSLHNNAGGVPENSLASFSAAIRAGLPLEIDVHLSADQQVVVFHDDNLLRMTGVEGTVGAQDTQSLQPDP